MVALAQRVEAIPCAHDLEAAVRELRLIAEHKPRYNRRSRLPRAGAVGAADRGAVPAAVGGAAGPAGRRGVPRARSPTGGPPTPRWPPSTSRCRCASAPPGCRRACSGTACALAGMGRCGAPCTGAQSRRRVRLDRRGLPRRRRRATPAPWSPRCWPGWTGWPPRSGTRTPRCSATGSPSWSGRCAAGSGWSRWPPCPSSCSPGPTATAAGSCPWSAAGRLVAAGLRAARARRSAARWPACWPPPRPPTGPDGELAASVDETELVLRWMEKPGTRLVELTGTLACPAPGTGAYSAFLDPGRGRPRRARPVRRRAVAGHARAARAGRPRAGRPAGRPASIPA